MKQKIIRFDVMTGQEKGEKMNNKRVLLIFVLILTSVVLLSGCSSDGKNQ